MEKKDFHTLNKDKNRNYIKKYLNIKNVIGSVIEDKRRICGWVIYRKKDKKIQILKISYFNKTYLNKIFENLIDKFKNIELNVADHELEMHLFLKNKNFFCSGEIKNKNYYKFSTERKQ